MVTLKTEGRKHIVTYKGKVMAFMDLGVALRVAHALYQLNK